MNNKGSVSAAAIVAIILLTLIYISISYMKSEDSYDSVYDIAESTQDLVNGVNSKERLHSLLNKNKSYIGKVVYDNLDKEFEIETLDETYENIIETASGNSSISFSINNDTSIDINAQGVSYDLELMYDEKDILNGQGIGLTGNKDIIINSEQIYNKASGEVNYGDYELVIKGDVDVTLLHDKLLNREVSITGEDYEQKMIIDDFGVHYKWKERADVFI